MAFGIGAFPFGIFASTFNLGDLRAAPGKVSFPRKLLLFLNQKRNRQLTGSSPNPLIPGASFPVLAPGTQEFIEEHFLNRAFLWLAFIFIVWLMIA